jgi:hypothetical protein
MEKKLFNTKIFAKFAVSTALNALKYSRTIGRVAVELKANTDPENGLT